MTAADRECLERLQSGDATALAELYDRHAALLYALALRITGNATEAEEALLEAWLQVVRKTAPFDPQIGLTAWLVRLVRTRALERRRNGSRLDVRPAAGGGPIEVTPEHVELTEAATVALGLLDDHERQVLELAFLDGLTQNEISGKMGVSMRDVKVWMRQALDRLDAGMPAQQEAA